MSIFFGENQCEPLKKTKARKKCKRFMVFAPPRFHDCTYGSCSPRAAAPRLQPKAIPPLAAPHVRAPCDCTPRVSTPRDHRPHPKQGLSNQHSAAKRTLRNKWPLLLQKQGAESHPPALAEDLRALARGEPGAYGVPTLREMQTTCSHFFADHRNWHGRLVVRPNFGRGRYRVYYLAKIQIAFCVT